MTSGNTPVSFMTGVASAGIELMSSNADYQNKLRTFESGLAQKQTESQSLAVTNQANAIVKSGKAQANTYYAQAGQSFGSALCDGGNFVRGAMDGEQAGLQKETENLAAQVKEHTDLLNDVDAKLNGKPMPSDQSAAGTLTGPRKNTNTDVDDDDLSDTDNNASSSSSDSAVAPSKVSQENREKAENDLDGNFLRTDGNRVAEDQVLESKRAAYETDASGNAIPNKTKLHTYRKDLQQKIELKQESINSKQQQISNMIQQRKMKFDMTKELIGGGSSMFQAGFANEKAQQDADSTEWGFNKELGSNVFTAASQAMTDCNNQTDKMIDGITGALRHVVGG